MRRKAWAMMMFIGSGRQRNSRRKSYGVCDNDFAYMVIAGVIALVIAGTISTIGLIVLIISLIRRHRAKVRGEKPKKFGLITGWILFLLPIFVVIGFIVYWFV